MEEGKEGVKTGKGGMNVEVVQGSREREREMDSVSFSPQFCGQKPHCGWNRLQPPASSPISNDSPWTADLLFLVGSPALAAQTLNNTV